MNPQANIISVQQGMQRMLLKGSLLYVLIGYVFYFAPLLLQQPSARAEVLIEYMKPVFKALKSAERVAMLNDSNPFPVQVLILYCACGAVLMAAWNMYVIFSNEMHMQASLARIKKTGYSRRFRLMLGVVCLIQTVIIFAGIFCIGSPANIGRTGVAFYSSSISAISFLLIISAASSLLFVGAHLYLYSVIFERRLTVLEGANHG